MPTSTFLLYRLPPGQQPSASDVETVQQAIDRLCPVPAGGRRGTNITMAASLTMLKQKTVEDAQLAKGDAMKDMWVVQVAGSDNRYLLPKGLPHVIEADARSRLLLEKRMGYRTSTTMMLKARNYTVGDRSSDVMIRVLQLVQSASLPPQGVALELVYLPTSDLGISSTVLQELAGAVVAALPPDTPGSLEVFNPSYSSYAAHLPAAYGSHHLAVAYLQVALALARGRA